MRAIKTQIAILGGGVAGLWLLNRLRAQGRHCLLIEPRQLGSGQTIFSQGIIHSGVKYALTGKLTAATTALQQVPDIWRACLRGHGEINLTNTEILSSQQYLWSPGSLGADMMTFLASKSLRSQVTRVARADYPEALAISEHKGAVYALEEPVLGVKTLLHNLSAPYKNFLLHAELSHLERSISGAIDTLHLNTAGQPIALQAETIIALAGEGNALLSQQFALTRPRMQRRPLSMVTVAAPDLPLLFAHAMQVSHKPRITITTHRSQQQTVWYLGGDLAETGVERTPEQQRVFAQQELKKLFPRLNFSAAEFKVLTIERAEGLQSSGLKPDIPMLWQENNVMMGWPTKLAFAPVLAQQIIERLPPSLVSVEQCTAETVLTTLKKPEVAAYPWE